MATKDYTKMHEWLLAIHHKLALQEQDYSECAAIQKEVNRRIELGTLNKALMDGFRCYSRETNSYYGSPNYTGLNGLFDNYHQNQ